METYPLPHAKWVGIYRVTQGVQPSALRQLKGAGWGGRWEENLGLFNHSVTPICRQGQELPLRRKVRSSSATLRNKYAPSSPLSIPSLHGQWEHVPNELSFYFGCQEA